MMTAPVNFISPGAIIGKGTKVWHFTYIGAGTKIGTDCMIGSLCHLDYNMQVHNNVRIQGNCHLSNDCIIEDDVFIGPGVITTNDRYPPSNNIKGVHFEKGCIIGAGAKLLSGITIGRNAVVSMGSVVTRDVLPGIWVGGVPAKAIGTRVQYEAKRRAYDAQIH